MSDGLLSSCKFMNTSDGDLIQFDGAVGGFSNVDNHLAGSGIVLTDIVAGNGITVALQSDPQPQPPLKKARIDLGTPTKAVISSSTSPPPIPMVTQIVYVNKNGNDSTGDGSQGAPFLTINHALSTITAT